MPDRSRPSPEGGHEAEVKEADVVELVEQARLDELRDVSAEQVYSHVEYLGRELPGPVDLYQRWERQQWSATGLDFGLDEAQWKQAPTRVREQLEGTFSGFFYGEQAVTDTLAPLLLGAPDEEHRLFLATQVVDEARHSYFFSRFYNHVLGVPGGLREALAALGRADESVREEDTSDGYDRIFDPRRGELATATEAVRLEPRSYGRWVQAITVYHLMVEGILALTGQRRVLRLLRDMDLLPAFRAGFTAVTRDESRHVSYGVWALRQAVAAGYEADIRAVVDRTLEPCLRVYANPAFKLPDPRQLPPPARQDPRETWNFALDAITKRLRSAGADAGWIASVEQRGRAQLAEQPATYERIHGVEHPVRVWERGEVEAIASR